MRNARLRRFKRPLGAIFTLAAAAGGLILLDASGVDAAAQTPPAPVPITISSTVPVELNAGNGGAPNATLDQAARFAWQEFIALNWPAALQTGYNRDTPAADCRFGDPACAARPLTWETFRGKAEIFTPVERQSSPSYDALPDYNNIYQDAVQPCPGVTPLTSPAWVNLDETSEIGLTAMYSGAGIPTPTAENSAPQLVRFTAKANRAEFNYAQQIGALHGLRTTLQNGTQAYVPVHGSPPAGSSNLVSLPNNTIEIKAGWRQLNPATEDVSRFHTTRVRYYEGASGNSCYREAVWGLLSLHIIQKTQSAPYFIFATFEQADNIRTEAGLPTEDRDGNVIAVQPCRSDQQAPCPTTPTTHYQDSPNPGTPTRATPPTVSLRPANAPYCTSNTATPPPNRLYYLNTFGETATPTGGYVCINARQHPIPPAIIAVNQQAHAAIDAYNQANGIAASPWSYYKLINVQFRPMTLTTPGQPYTGPDASTFYQSNSVVESNYTLQNFSGRLAGNTGTKSDYASYFGLDGPGVVPTLYYRQAGQTGATSYNMGGCMGCHATAQRAGGDFSFILLNGAVNGPEPIPQPSRSGARGVDFRRASGWEAPPRRQR